MASTPSTDEVMAETGPILSTLPTSSSSTLEKISVRSVWRALAVQRYTASPVKSSQTSMATAVSRAFNTAVPALAAVISSAVRLLSVPDKMPANSAVPMSVPSFKAVMRKIHPQSPLAMRMSVRFKSNM